MEHYTMIHSSGMVNCMRELDEVRKTILAVLVSHKDGCTLNQLHRSYYELEGGPVPWRKFGYCTINSFLSSMPDIIKIEEHNNEVIIKGIPSQRIKHITNMVAGQKNQEMPSRRTFRPSPLYPTTRPSVAFVSAAMLTKLIIFIEQYPEGVKIDYILREISSYMCYTRITMEDLETQLQWLSHRIYCTSNKVYPKKPRNKQDPSDSVNYKGYSLIEMFNNNIRVNAKILISDHIKFQLEKLINKHSDGIWCSDLPDAFLDEYGVHLYYIEIGFNSVVEFASVLPEIFHLVQCLRTGNFKLFYSRREIPLFDVQEVREIGNLEDQTKKTEKIPLKDQIKNTERIPQVMKRKLLTPNDVVVIGDYVEPIKVKNIKCNDLNFIEVNVCEVYTPTVFWIRLRSYTRIFTKFVMQFHNFYVQEHKHYQIPHYIIEKGLYCACKYDGQWQRAIIKKVEENRVTVVFLDYGTIKSYPPESLYYLHKTFSSLPSQAILCSLFNIKPNHRSHWPDNAIQKFAQLTSQKDLVAIVMSRNEEKNSMSITLTDTSKHDYDLHITDILIELKLATIGKIICKKNENFLFEYYLKCKHEEEAKIKKMQSVAGNVKNEKEATDDVENEEKRNLENKEEEHVENKEEESKENDLNYNFAMDLYEWGSSTNNNSNGPIISQNNNPQNVVCKKPNINLVNDKFFKAVKNSSGYASCDRFIPWSPSGNIIQKFNYDALNLEYIEDSNDNNDNIITKTKNNTKNDVSEVLSIKLSIPIKNEIEVQNSKCSYKINRTKNTSNDETDNNSIETSRKDTRINVNTLNQKQKISLIEKLLNLRQMKSNSEDMSVSESISNSDNSNSAMKVVLTELSKVSEPIKADIEFDDTVFSQKKGSECMNQVWTSDQFTTHSFINAIEQTWASDESAKRSSLNTKSNFDCVKRKTKSVPIKNTEVNTKKDSSYQEESLLVERTSISSSSEIEKPEVSRENSLSAATSSSNDSNLNSDLARTKTKSVLIENIEPETKKDINSLKESVSDGSSINSSSEVKDPETKKDINSLKESGESSINSSSEVEEPVEMLNENSLIAINHIKIFNDIDLESCSEYDVCISDPRSFFQ